MKQIGKIIATEKAPTTVDEFFFWTDKTFIIRPFDVIKVEHVDNSITFGVVVEISHLTDNSSFLASFISSDFGDVNYTPAYSNRIGMNYVTARVVANSKNIYTPVLDGKPVSLATEEEVKQALGLDDMKNPVPCGYIDMYEPPHNITIPVHFNSKFLVGPEGAHLNISGISGLASKTSYAMFLMKGLHEKFINNNDESVAFIIMNVKGRDLLKIDEPNDQLSKEDKNIYKSLGLEVTPFKNVTYFYPHSDELVTSTYCRKDDLESQLKLEKAYMYKYIFEEDRENIDLLFSNVDDPNQTMESIVNYIITEQGGFGSVSNWNDLREELLAHTKTGMKQKNEITVLSWRKFYRLFSKTISKTTIFSNRLNTKPKSREIRLKKAITDIKKNDVFVIDIAKLDEETQGFVFGDVIRAVYDVKLGSIPDRDENDIPSKIIIFIDELNKYASKDVPKSSPILHQLLDITERGRSLGIILFSAEQFRNEIHERVKGNCATHAYGRTNAIEISKPDFQYIPPVYKSMLTRLKPGEYIIQNPVFRSLLNIKFPHPLYNQK